MGHEDLKSFILQDEVADMKSVSMSSSCSVEEFSIMIDSSGTYDDFIETICVKVSYRKRVGALAIYAVITEFLGFVQPSGLEFSKSTAHT